MKILHTILAVALISVSVIAQKSSNNFITQKSIPSAQKMDIPTIRAEYFSLDLNSLNGILKSTQGRQSSIIALPLPDGTVEEFQIQESVVMSAVLAAKFPNIKTYVGTSVTNASTSVRFDMSPNGFHAMMFTPKGTVYIDPVHRKNKNEYQSYYKRDFLPQHKGAIQEGEPIDYNPELTKQINEMVAKGVRRPSGTELRTYRLAVAATGEYTAFHGGTVEGALAAIVTTMNRVNGIYEREVSIRMVLVDNTDELIFTDAASDGFSNSNADALINEVQAKIDEIIGDANYDIGHGVSTGGGGLAGLGVPCQSGSKGKGITGSSQPIGDPYDVDFVAHELGHQFGGNHTFNGSSGNCAGSNRTASAAYEPGSGTTIMAYAGICSGQNIQNNSDPYFHTQSFDQIIAYSTISEGNTCAVITATGNNAPTVTAGEGGFTIPISTPFKLDGSATDPDGDDLTYSWEQFDLGPAGAPGSPVGNAPLFRAFSPTSESHRDFPQITDIVNNSMTMGEILPDYTRSLKFRLIARDNKDGGGGVDYDEISFEVSDQAGPFVVTEPNTAITWYEGQTQIVIWDVANTNMSPVNCTNVNILLSIDGGMTYPVTLLSNAPNNGVAEVIVPNNLSSTCRVKIVAADNIFYDISNVDLEIAGAISCNATIPTGLAAEEINATDVTLIWDENAGAIFDIQYSPSGTNSWITINAGGNTKQITELDPETAYDVQVRSRCTGSLSDYTSIITFTTLVPPIIYCTSIGGDASDEHIGRVQLETIDNASGAAGGYTDYTAISTDLISGEEYTIVITPTWTSTIFDEGYAMWIDYNQNGDFEDEGEEVWVKNISQETPVSGMFTIPVTAKNGSTRMRVALKYEGIPSSCESFSFGEVEDYTVNIFPGSRPAQPTSFIATTISSSEIVLTWVDNATNETGYRLDRSVENANSFTELVSLAMNSEGHTDRGLDANTKYEYRLVAVNGDSDSQQILSEATTLNSIPLAPTDLDSENSVFKIALQWTDNSDNEAEFVIERSVGDNTNFEELGIVSADILKYDDFDVEPKTNYVYRVYTRNNGGSSDYSNEISAGLITGLADDLLKNSIQIYPNPSNGIFKLKIVDNKFGRYDVVLTNIVGKVIENSSFDKQQSSFEKLLDLSNQPKGIYLIQISNGEGISTHRVMKH